MRIKKIGKVTSLIVAILVAFTSFTSIYNPGIYNDNDFVIAMWSGNDLVTAIIVLPLLIAAMVINHKKLDNSFIFTLIWLGVLWYFIYNYFFYLFGASYNSLFLLYVLIIILSVVSFIHLILALYPNLDNIFNKKYMNYSYKGLGIFMRVFAVVLGSMWVIMIVGSLIKGEVPEAILQTGHPTGVVFATDLIFLVTPLFVLGSYVKYKNKLVIVLSFAILMKCALYPMVFIVAGINTYLSVGSYDPLTPIYLILGAICGYQLIKIKRKLI